ncbi:MAG: hypothetical protein O2807_05960 [bacterium]|nr:hypothetical protein [bacterium]
MPDVFWESPGGLVTAALAVALSLAGVLGRIVYAELRGRMEQAEQRLRFRLDRAEGRIDEIHVRYARRDDLTRELEAIRKSFVEVFSELRRANEGIAALRGSGVALREFGGGDAD